jgi:hypothetical protein
MAVTQARRNFLLKEFRRASSPWSDGAYGTVELEVAPANAGYMSHYVAAGDTWAALRDGAGTHYGDSPSSNQTCRILSDAATDKWERMDRPGYTFKLSDYGDYSEYLAGAYLRIDSQSAPTSDFDDDIVACSFAPASNTVFVAGDYDSFGTVDWSNRININDWDGNAYQTFALNSTALTQVLAALATGYFRIGLRHVADIDDVEPTWVASKRDEIFFEEENDATNPPRLILVFDVATVVDPIHSVDIGRSIPAGESWATIRDHTDADLIDQADGTLKKPWLRADTTSNLWDEFHRSGYTFDMYNVSGEVLGAILLLGESGAGNADYGGQLVGCSFSPADDESIVNGDYDSFGTTDWTVRKDLTLWDASAQYKTLEFNAAGITALQSAINAQSHFVLGLRLDHDIDNVEPTWVSTDEDYLFIQELTDANYPPKLLIALKNIVITNPSAPQRVETHPLDIRC